MKKHFILIVAMSVLLLLVGCLPEPIHIRNLRNIVEPTSGVTIDSIISINLIDANWQIRSGGGRRNWANISVSGKHNDYGTIIIDFRGDFKQHRIIDSIAMFVSGQEVNQNQALRFWNQMIANVPRIPVTVDVVWLGYEAFVDLELLGEEFDYDGVIGVAIVKVEGSEEIIPDWTQRTTSEQLRNLRRGQKVRITVKTAETSNGIESGIVAFEVLR
jgi:hypothetical protein